MKIPLQFPIPLLGICLCLSSSLSAAPLRWKAALGTDRDSSSGESAFVAVEGSAETENGQAAQAFLAARAKDEFKFGGLARLDDDDEFGVVVRVSDHGGGSWAGDWQARAQSNDGASFTDLAIDPATGAVYVCGSAKGALSFKDASGNQSQSLSMGGQRRGFVAWLDPQTGGWLGAFRADDLQPESLVVEADGSILMTGAGALAVKYSSSGRRDWLAAAPASVTRMAHIAAGTNPGTEHVYVLYEDAGSISGHDVVLAQLDCADGSERWSMRMGSAGEDLAGGLDVGPLGEVVLTYTAKHAEVFFDGAAVAVDFAVAARHAMMARVGADASTHWVKPLGAAQNKDASLLTSDLDIDPSGVAWVCGECDGDWAFIPGEVDTMVDTALLLGLDASGELFQYHQSWGESRDMPHAVAAPAANFGMMAGEYSDGWGLYWPVNEFLPDRGGKEGGFFAVVAPRPGQQLTVVRPDPANQDKDEIRFVEWLIEQFGMSSYASVINGPLGTAVSIWLVDEEIEMLEQVGGVILEPEMMLEANGISADTGWALARLADGALTGTPESGHFYQYPETSGEVILYLIDTAVANPGGWFGGNPNLTFEESILIRGVGDPTESSQFEHGTQMLSLIAGPETGAAQGTPIRVVNYDVYPSGPTTTATLVAKAVVEAVRRHEQDPSGSPGVICLASSSSSTGVSWSLRVAIDLALDAGLPVVVSAGNLGGDVSQYIPANYGVDSGVICVGAANQWNQRTAISNYGPAVDLHAPGEQVKCVNFTVPASGSYDLISGTSPATAFAAAAAVVELSNDATCQAGEVENLLRSNAHAGAATNPGAVAPLSLLQMGALWELTVSPVDPTNPGGGGTAAGFVTGKYLQWAAANGMTAFAPAGDSDGDGTLDLLEYVQGSDPLVAGAVPKEIEYSADTDAITYTFQISADLFNVSNPQVLLDGLGWEIQCSNNMTTWHTAYTAVTVGGAADGRIPVSCTLVPDAMPCFVRLVVNPPVGMVQ